MQTLNDATPWTGLPRAGFDLETTGTDPLQARPVTASLIIVSPDDEILQHHEWMIDPGIEIPTPASAVHGVDTARARAEGLPAAEGARQIIEMLDLVSQSMPIVAFNGCYDLTVMRAEAHRHQIPEARIRDVIDPLIIDRKMDKWRKGKRKLEVMANHYGVELLDAHTSAADVMATLKLASALAKKYPREVDTPAAALTRAQAPWFKEWAENFQHYLRTKADPRDPSAVIDTQWPMRVLPQDWQPWFHLDIDENGRYVGPPPEQPVSE